MDFDQYLTTLGLDPTALDASTKTALQSAWRRESQTVVDRQAADLQALRDSRPAGPSQFSPSGGRPGAGSVLEAGLLMHMGVSQPQAAKFYGQHVVDAASDRRNRVTGLQQVMRACLSAAGAEVPSGKFTNTDIANAFRAVPRGGEMQSSVGVSTQVQLSGILSNVANKSLLNAFQNTPTTYGKWCKLGSNVDFKAATRYRLTGKGEFLQIAPAGEIKHVGLTEASASATLATYGALMGISREEIINDDLSAFAAMPAVLSRMAALKVEKVAVAKLLENSGGTTSGFFSTTNVNYASGGGSALQNSALVTAYQKFVEQTDSNGDPVMVPPKILAVPPALEITALALVNSVNVIGTPASNALAPDGNPWAGKFEVVVIPHLADIFGLTNSSDTGWYLLAAPSDFSCVEVNFLNGVQQPTVETADFDFDRLGISMRAYHDFSANTLEYRGGVLSAGA